MWWTCVCLVLRCCLVILNPVSSGRRICLIKLKGTVDFGDIQICISLVMRDLCDSL